MAGLKSTQLSDTPVAFWTFDTDQTGLNGNQIVDEIGNGNPMIVNSDLRGDNYLLEQQSLNPIETADQHALTVANGDKNDTHNDWLTQYFEVVHTTAFDFPDQGEFSVEWLMYKTPAGEINDFGEPGYARDIVTPLISKGSVFNAVIVDDWGSQDYLRVSILGRSITLYNNVYPIWNRMNHCVATYTVNQTDVNEYESVVKFYVNGRLIGTNTQTHVDTFPNTSTSASWLFCGDGGTDPVTDFATERLTLDQIAVYARGLTEQEVANHYRKTKQYDQMIKDDYPQHYWRLDEEHDPLNLNISADVGGVTGRYYGAVNRDQQGPDRIVQSRSPYFQKGSAAYIDNLDTSNRFNVVLHPNQDYTLEFWFKSRTNERGLLFDCTEEHPDSWDGIRVFLNSKGNTHYPGNIQISESYENNLASLDLDANGDRYLFNDDEWHYVVMRRSGNTLSLWVDGLKHAEADFAKVSTSKPGQVHLMNGRPGDYAVEGNMCEIAFHQRALQPQQIYNRYIFSTRYKISGFTLLQGAPVKALLRFYDSVNGELVHELESNGVTGEYIYYPLDNRHLDIVSKLPENNTTRYRVHGPVAPAEYDDSHLQ